MNPPINDDTQKPKSYTYDEAVDKIAESYGIPRSVYRHMLQQESGDNDDAVSPKKAATAFQIMPGTAKQLGYTIEELKADPLKAAEAGLRYLRDNYKTVRKYTQNEKHAWMASVAAYHAGPGAVVKDFQNGGLGLPNTSDGLITTRNHVMSIFRAIDKTTLDRSPLKTKAVQDVNKALPSPGYSDKLEPVTFTGGEPTPLQRATRENVAALYGQSGNIDPLGWLKGSTAPTTPLPADVVAQATYEQIRNNYGLQDTEEFRTGFMTRWNAMKLGQTSRVLTIDEDKYLAARKVPSAADIAVNQAAAATGQPSPAQPQKLVLGQGAYTQADDQTDAPTGTVRMTDKDGRTFFARKDATSAPAQDGTTQWMLARELPDWAKGTSKPVSELPKDKVLRDSYGFYLKTYHLPDTEELRQKFITGYTKVQKGEATGVFDAKDELFLQDLAQEIENHPEKYRTTQTTRVVRRSTPAAPTTRVAAQPYEESGSLTTRSGRKLQYAPDRTGLKEGEVRFVDEQGETYISDTSARNIRDESLAQPAFQADIDLLPENQRYRTTPELAKRVMAAQIGNRLKSDLQSRGESPVPVSDTEAFYSEVGYRKLESGEDYKEEDYFASGSRKTEPFTITRREMQGLREFSNKRRKMLEDWAIGVMSTGRQFTAAEKEQLAQNDVDLTDLSNKRYDDVEMAKVKGDVAKQDFRRYLTKFEAQEGDKYIARLKAESQVGWIDKTLANNEIEAYQNLRKEKTSSFTNPTMAAAGLFDPRGQVIVEREVDDYMRATLERYQTVTARNQAIVMERAMQDARDQALAQMSWPEYLARGTVESPLRVLKSAISIGIGGTWKGIALGAKGLDTLLGVNGDKPVTEYESWKIGDNVDRWLNKLPLDDRLQESFWFGDVPQGLGSTLGMAVGGSSRFPKITIGFMSALQQGAGAYEEALKSGASEEQAQFAGWLNMPFGATEVVGMGNAILRLNKGPGAAVWKNLVKQAWHEAKKEVPEEMLQEGLQTTAGNVIARVTYDPDRPADKDLVRSMAAAGISSSLFSFGVTYLNGVRNRRVIQKLIDREQANGSIIQNYGDGVVRAFDQKVEYNEKTGPLIDTYDDTRSQIQRAQTLITTLEEQAGRAKTFGEKKAIIKDIWKTKAVIKELQEKQGQAATAIVKESGIKVPDTTIGETVVPSNPVVTEDPAPDVQEFIAPRAKTFEERLPKRRKPRATEVTAEPVETASEAPARREGQTSDDYYIAKGEVSTDAGVRPAFERVEGTPIELPGYEQGDFFTHIDGNTVIISEGSTGRKIAWAERTKTAKNWDNATRKATLSALERLNQRKDAMADIRAIFRGGTPTPRYGREAIKAETPGVRGKANPNFTPSQHSPAKLKAGDWFRKGRFQYEVKKIDGDRIIAIRNDTSSKQTLDLTVDELADEFNTGGGGFNNDYEFEPLPAWRKDEKLFKPNGLYVGPKEKFAYDGPNGKKVAASVEIAKLPNDKWIVATKYDDRRAGSGSAGGGNALFAYGEESRNYFNSRESALSSATKGLRRQFASDPAMQKWLDNTFGPILRGAAGSADTKKLLLPETVNFNPDDLKKLETQTKSLQDEGYQFKVLSGGTVAITRIPASVSAVDARNDFERRVRQEAKTPVKPVTEFQPSERQHTVGKKLLGLYRAMNAAIDAEQKGIDAGQGSADLVKTATASSAAQMKFKKAYGKATVGEQLAFERLRAEKPAEPQEMPEAEVVESVKPLPDMPFIQDDSPQNTKILSRKIKVVYETPSGRRTTKLTAVSEQQKRLQRKAAVVDKLWSCVNGN